MRWFLRALILAYFLAIITTASAYRPLVRWVTDKPFACTVAVALQDNLSALTITCRRPVLPRCCAAIAQIRRRFESGFPTQR